MFTEVIYSVTEELKTIPIPIKREPYILVEDGGNENTICQNLAYTVLSSQL